MAVNITSIKTSSDGAWQGDNPLHYAFPLLIIQTTLILVVSRSLAFLLKPLRQPKVIAEIIGGILLGPSALGRNQDYLHNLFPKWSMPILETVASVGLLFFLFLVGLELDIASIQKSGKRAFSIAAAGITVPFVSGIGVAFILRKTVDGVGDVGLAQFIVFMGVALSITAFPVLARILAELKLLTTQVGETAMAAAAFNDVVAWVLLALAVALAGDGNGGGGKSPLISVWVLLSGVAFVAFMMVAVRPVMSWVANRCTPDSDTVDELYVCLTLLGVMVSGFMTDFIGIHSIFGAFVFGLTIPKGEFAGILIERIEDFVSGLLLPLYFASSGLKTDVTKISQGSSFGMLALVIFTACSGKIFGTFIVAMLHKIPARESLTLGLLMNTKGLVELIVLNIGKEKKVLNDEIFAILVLMALFTTFMTTPSVMAVYKPARSGGSPHIHRKLQPDSPSTADCKKELRILACVHGSSNVPALINLIESTRGTKKSPLKLYVMHLVELTERSSSIIMVQRARRNGVPFWNRRSRNGALDRVGVAFQAYGQLGRVQVRPMTAISALSTMHEDVCNVAEDKRVTMVILPFHKRGRNDDVMPMENMGPAWRSVNQNVLKNAQCSVAMLIDRGLGSEGQTTPGPTSTVAQAVCVLFFGGPDDREALVLGGRMAEHPGVKMTVVRFIEKKGKELDSFMLRPSPKKNADDNYSFSTAVMDRQREEELDGEAVSGFMKRWDGMADYVEKATSNIVEEVVTMGRSGEYELIMVGKGRFPSTIVAGLADNTAEHPELGPIGDILGSSRHGVFSSVLVIQQHDTAHANELPVSKVTDSDTSTAMSPMYHGTSTSTTLSPV